MGTRGHGAALTAFIQFVIDLRSVAIRAGTHRWSGANEGSKANDVSFGRHWKMSWPMKDGRGVAITSSAACIDCTHPIMSEKLSAILMTCVWMSTCLDVHASGPLL